MQYVAKVTIVACLIVSPSATAMAQVNQDSLRARQECKRAEQILKTGEPAALRPWAATNITACGTGAAAVLTDAVQHLRGITDTGQVYAVVDATRFVRDAALYQVILGLLVDPAATDDARVGAMEMTLLIESPGLVVDRAKIRSLTAHAFDCGTNRYVTDVLPEVVTPLPANHLSAEMAAVQGVLGVAPSGSVLHRVASCTARALDIAADTTS